MGGHRIRFGEKNGKCFVENDMVTIVNILDSTHTHMVIKVIKFGWQCD